MCGKMVRRKENFEKGEDMTSNEVIDLYEKENVKLTIRPLDGEENAILIEGNQVSLEFLGKLIMAHAQSINTEGCSRKITPNGAGNAYFTQESTLGIYLHTLPCEFEGREHSRL